MHLVDKGKYYTMGPLGCYGLFSQPEKETCFVSKDPKYMRQDSNIKDIIII